MWHSHIQNNTFTNEFCVRVHLAIMFGFLHIQLKREIHTWFGLQIYFLRLYFYIWIFYYAASLRFKLSCAWFYRLALSEDTALSMAFSVARRAAAVPVLLVNGTHKTTTRLYLDSLILQHQLQHLSGSGSVLGSVILISKIIY